MQGIRKYSKIGLATLLTLVMGLGILPATSLLATDYNPEAEEVSEVVAPDTVIVGNYTITNAAQTINTAWRTIDANMVFVPIDGNLPANPIRINPGVTFQEFTGVGMSIDHTSVTNLWRLPEAARREAIRLIACRETGAGMNIFRLCIGASDMIDTNASLPWTYSDTELIMCDKCIEGPVNPTCAVCYYYEDWDLEGFTIKKDIEQKIVATCLEILEFNPDAIFLGSAWSAPAWMKEQRRFPDIRAEHRGFVARPATAQQIAAANRPGLVLNTEFGWPNEDQQDTYLRSDAVDVYALYLVKFMQAYEELGVPIAGVTMVNENKVAVQYAAMDILWSDMQRVAMSFKRQAAEVGMGDRFMWVCDFNEGDWDSQWSKRLSNMFTQNYGDPDSNPELSDGSIICPSLYDNHINAYRASDAIAFHPYGYTDQWGPNEPSKTGWQASQQWGMNIHNTESNQFYFGQNGYDMASRHGSGQGIMRDFHSHNYSSWIGWATVTNTNGGNHLWRNTDFGRIDDNAFFFPPRTGWTNRLLQVPTSNPTAYSIWQNTGNTGSRNTILLIGHITKYVDEGARRIEVNHNRVGSNVSVNTTNNNSWHAELAFQNPCGEIVLIVRNSNAAAQTGFIVVEGFDGYIAQITIPAKSYTTYRFHVDGSAGMPLTEKVYEISVDVEDEIALDAEGAVVTVSNIGNQRTGAFNVALSGSDADAFVLSNDTIYGIDPTGLGMSLDTFEFTVAPVADLPSGLYKATVTIGGNPRVAAETFDVTFYVPQTDIEFLEERAAAIRKNGLSEGQLLLSANNKATLTLVYEGRSFVLATNVNNRNVSGEVDLGDGFFLVFDIKGNGSNVKVFEIVER